MIAVCLWAKCVFHHFARVVVKWSKLNIICKRDWKIIMFITQHYWNHHHVLSSSSNTISSPHELLPSSMARQNCALYGRSMSLVLLWENTHTILQVRVNNSSKMNQTLRLHNKSDQPFGGTKSSYKYLVWGCSREIYLVTWLLFRNMSVRWRSIKDDL